MRVLAMVSLVLVCGCDTPSPTHFCDDVGGCNRADTGPVCDPAQPFDCSSPDQCVAWMQTLVPAGTTPHSICGRARQCTRGTAACFSVGDGFQCQCSDTLTCMPGEVCVSDTPDGPTRCVAACASR